MEINYRNRLGHLYAHVLLATTALLALTPVPLRAAAFTPGNLVIYRVGDGIGNEVKTGNPVSLDEYTTRGTLVQSLALPTSASGAQKPLISNGTSSMEGFLTRSTDGRYLLVPGFGTTPGGPLLLSTYATNVPRVIGRVDISGAMDTSTALTNWATRSAPFSAASTDGTVFWGCGGSGITCALALGATTSTALTESSASTQQVGIFNGQLYVSASGTALHGIGSVGTGTMTGPGQSYTLLPGFTDSVTLQSPLAFFFCHLNGPGTALDTLYVCDSTTTGPPGGLNKFSLVDNNWVANGSVGIPADGYAGLCATVNGTTVTLYATRKLGSVPTGGGELVQVVDTTGYNAAMGSPPITLLATASNKMAFRGVTLAPMAAPAFNLTASANPCGYQSRVTFTASPLGSAPVTGTMQFTTNGGNLGSAVLLSNGSATSPATSCLPRGLTNVIQAIYSGDANYFACTNTLTQSVTNHPPVANPGSYSRGKLNGWKIAVSDLLTNASDAMDGDAVSLDSVSSSTPNVTLLIAGGYVLYTNTNLVDDQFSYTVTDGFGGTNTAAITLTADGASGVGGQIRSVAFTGGTARLRFAGIPGYKYQVQLSTNIRDWNTVWITNAPGGGGFLFEDGNAPTPTAFYRLMWNGN